jgi:hypothetical protein
MRLAFGIRSAAGASPFVGHAEEGRATCLERALSAPMI